MKPKPFRYSESFQSTQFNLSAPSHSKVLLHGQEENICRRYKNDKNNGIYSFLFVCDVHHLWSGYGKNKIFFQQNRLRMICHLLRSDCVCYHGVITKLLLYGSLSGHFLIWNYLHLYYYSLCKSHKTLLSKRNRYEENSWWWW